MEDIRKKLFIALLEAILLGGLVFLSVVLLWLESRWLGPDASETGVTESVQTILVTLTMIFVGVCSKQRREERGLFILMTGFYACVLIREQDFLFDQLSHGSWVYFAVTAAVLAIYWSRKFPGTVKVPMMKFLDSRSYIFTMVGLVVLLVFSRTFGSSMVWKELMGESYDGAFKQRVQEGTELLGYLILFHGSVLLLRESFLPRRRER